MLNFRNIRNAKNVSPHCPIFLHFLAIILHICCFVNLFPHVFPTYVQHLPNLSTFQFFWGCVSYAYALHFACLLYRQYIRFPPEIITCPARGRGRV
jgi:hypothetical protein